jgi:aminoglycoside phosphotransferase (APT) family kinase protein
MSASVAPDDIVATHAETAGNARPPLLVIEPLRRFLDEHGLGAGELRASPIGEGHSNVTYLIEREGAKAVLRRPPRPPLPPSAHDVLREARLLRALAGTCARVPSVLAVCEDERLIGAPFYVMELIEGEVIVSEVPESLDTPVHRREIGEELIEALAEIHAVDWRAAGLDGFGKPTGYLERQVRRFGGLWEVNKTREIPAVERVRAWLERNMPESGATTVVHGDYRLGNTIFAARPPARLRAVLDWEMATIGDPLADLGYLCMMWTEGGDPAGGMRDYLGGVTRREGFPTRGQRIEC